MRQPKKRKKTKAKLHGALFILKEIKEERERQDEKWGVQNHPIGNGAVYIHLANFFRELCDTSFNRGHGTYAHILLEEVAEALAETTPDGVRGELIQVAAVVVAMIEKIDRGGL
jgi:hypothetical protein